MNRLLLMKTSAYRLNLIIPQIITLQAIPKMSIFEKMMNFAILLASSVLP
jgi:hypothetical protein